VQTSRCRAAAVRPGSVGLETTHRLAVHTGLEGRRWGLVGGLRGTRLASGQDSVSSSAGWRAAERRHPTGCERMDSPTLQTLQDPILLLPWACFECFPNPNPPATRELTPARGAVGEQRVVR
jgi:hypothetical protein